MVFNETILFRIWRGLRFQYLVDIAVSIIRAIIDRFRTTFTLVSSLIRQRRRTVRTDDATAAVEQSIE